MTQIEQALHAKGEVSGGVLSVEVDRDELGSHRLRGVPVSASFQINGALTFRPLRHGRALFNGDFPLKPSEVNGFIDALLRNGLVFQAEHQHFYDLTPEVWFIHFRGVGDSVSLARGVYAAMRTTSVKLPQAPPKHPHTPLDVRRLTSILGGGNPTIGAGGVVTFTFTQPKSIDLGGVRLNQNANAETNIVFEPLNGSGTRAAVAPDWGMFAWNVQSAIATMRGDGWDIGCLYNQETGEQPQLYFSHDFQAGDPYALAQQLRQVIDRLHLK